MTDIDKIAIETPPAKKRKTEMRKKIFSGPPKKWKEVFEAIREFRKDNEAPVDSMGCERLAETADPKVFRYQTLVSLQLSSQTKDPVNAEAMMRLRAHPKGLTVDSVIEIEPKELNEMISKVGFHNRKTQYLKKTAQILKEKYDGDIPKTVEELMELPGVGPKMAYLCMQCAWNENAGIGVDTHVHRISNRLGWAKSKDPEDTRLQLEDWLPKEHWREINHMLVGFGQVHCTPLRPKCSECPVKHLCPKVGTRSSSP